MSFTKKTGYFLLVFIYSFLQMNWYFETYFEQFGKTLIFFANT